MDPFDHKKLNTKSSMTRPALFPTPNIGEWSQSNDKKWILSAPRKSLNSDGAP
jgi:hypothetical protein